MAAGLSALFAAAPAAFTMLRLCGAAYLLYLGIQALRSARRGSPLAASQAGSRVSGRYAYLRGAATNLVNPKMVTFVVAFLPQFVDRSLGHMPAQFAVLGAIFIALEVLVGTAGDQPARQITRRKHAAHSRVVVAEDTFSGQAGARLVSSRPQRPISARHPHASGLP